MQVLRLVVTLFLVGNNTAGDYEPQYIVMAHAIQSNQKIATQKSASCFSEDKEGSPMVRTSVKFTVNCRMLAQP